MRNFCVGMKAVRSAFLLVGLAIALLEQPARGQTGDSGSDERFNYAFATQLGSGIYDVSGRTVQIYRLPFSFNVREAEGRAPRIRVELPICFGFYDLDAEDVQQTDMQDNFATVSFVPGVAVGFSALPNWSLEPFLEFGIAEDFDGSGSAYVYALGVKSVATFNARRLVFLLGNRLVYTGAHTPGVEIDEDFAMLETGFEVRRPLQRTVKGHGIDWGPYVMNYLYLEPTEVLLKEAPLEIGGQYELGITLGTQAPVDLWCFEVPRLGIGYRFGDGVSALRVVLGAAF